MTRSFGDVRYKKNKKLSLEEQIVTAIPDVGTHPVTPEDEFLILASDGNSIFVSPKAIFNIFNILRNLGLFQLTRTC
jgi:serine/threonine protein phosphatase PrpC